MRNHRFTKYERRDLEYLVDDFLHLKGSLNREKSIQVKKLLLSRPPARLHLFSVEGFVLAGNLVLVQDLHPDEVRHLIFLRPNDGRLHIRSLAKRNS